MNTDTVSGKFDQLKGQAKQSIGEATNNDSLANSGALDQVKGAAKETWGSAKDVASHASTEARIEADEDRLNAKAHGEDTAHNIREGVVNAAQNVKNFLTGHDEAIKHDR